MSDSADSRNPREFPLHLRCAPIHAELRQEYGVHMARKRVARLMRAAGLKGVQKRRFICTTRSGERQRWAPDLVDRDFTAGEPDKLWVADATYIASAEGFLYLSVVVDAFSRRVVGWAMDGRLQTTLVLAALEMAHAQRVPSGVIHHSDHGCQYTSIALGKRCRELGVRPSMGSVGDCFDNAMAESFFSSLECEVLDRCRFGTREEARVAVFSWIEGWYNTHRRHSSLGYLSPIEFERGFIEGQSSGNPELLPLTRQAALREDPMRNRSKSEEVLENMMLTQRSH